MTEPASRDEAIGSLVRDADSGQTAALLEALFHNVGVGLALWDAELRYAQVNDALAAINGRPAADHIGRSAPEVLGDLGTELEQTLRRVLETGEPAVDLLISGETPAHPGLTRHWLASYYPAHEAGRTVGIAAAVVEVTAEREATAREERARGEARATGALLDALFAAAPVGIAFWNTELRYERVNRAMAEINAAPLDEHVGRTPRDVMGEMGEAIMACLQQAIDTREPVYEAQLRAEVAGRPGVLQHREGSWFPVFDDEGSVVGVGGVVRDVSDRAEAEAERARLLEDAVAARAQAEAERARTEFLVDAGAKLASSMDYSATLQHLAQTAVRRLADWCVITTVESGRTLSTQAVAHADREKTDMARDLIERYPPRWDVPHGAAQVIRTGELELIRDISDAQLGAIARDESHLAILRELRLRSSLTVPLRAWGVTLGAITLVLAESGREFSDDDVSLARALADRAALHIRNAQLYTERSNIARTLQSSLLPRALPVIPGVEVAARYVAAGHHNRVGGDFYDVFPMEQGAWAAVLGDVSGKGAEAAAITSLARHTLRTAAVFTDSPERTLKTLNAGLRAEVQTTRFCTVLYARVCPTPTGALLTFANGGHGAPRVLRQGGGVEHVDVEGMLIGIMADVGYKEVDVELGPGDVVLMVTDGVTEIRGHEPDYGEHELDEVLSQLHGRSADGVCEAVLATALAAHGGAPRDDMALLALRVPHPASPGG